MHYCTIAINASTLPLLCHAPIEALPGAATSSFRSNLKSAFLALRVRCSDDVTDWKGPDLGRVLDKLTNLQPVSAFDRITSTQVNTAFAALDLTMPDGVVGQAFSKSPYLTDWYQYRMLRRRISKLRSSDIDLAESPEGLYTPLTNTIVVFASSIYSFFLKYCISLFYC